MQTSTLLERKRRRGGLGNPKRSSRCARTVAAGFALLATLSSAASEVQSQEGKATVLTTELPKPVPMPPLPPAVIDNNLEIAGKSISAREIDTRMTVEVRVNGHGPYRFLVDSGADTSVVSDGIASGLNLPVGTQVLLHSVAGSTKVGRVLVDQLTLGTTTTTRLELPALRKADMGADGIIGIDALSGQRLMLDFDKKVIKVEDARQRVAFVNGEIVVTARRRRGQLILTQVGAGRIQLQAIIDTGSQISIGNLALRDQLMRRGKSKFETVVATSVTGGRIPLQVARIAELRLGSVVLQDVPIAFADVPPFALFGLVKEPGLLLGTDLLESFRRVSLDFKARKVRFQLRRCGSDGVIIRTSTTNAPTRLSSGGDLSTCRHN
jgi:Aspartyl protease